MVDTVTWRLKNWYINFPGGFLGGHRMIEQGGGSYFFKENCLFRNVCFFFFEISQGGPMGSMGQGRWAMADGPQGPGPREPPRGGIFQGPRPMGPHGLHGPRGPPMGEEKVFFIQQKVFFYPDPPPYPSH